MKFSIERSTLLKTLGHVQSVVERRNTIPILSNVKVEGAEGQLSLCATDMDLEVVETISTDIAVAGATTVPAHTLYEIVRKLPDGADVMLDGDGDAEKLYVRSGRSRFSLPCRPASDFP